MVYLSNIGEFTLTKKDILAIPKRGEGYKEIKQLANQRHVKRQLFKIDPENLQDHLWGYGAWSEIELENHDENLIRFLWIAVNDLREEKGI